MNKIIGCLFFIILGANSWSQPRAEKPSGKVIIDTDCAFDDMRAISLLLSRPEISVKAILISEGSLSPEVGAEKVLSLLHEFNRNDIPIAISKTVKGINPVWRTFCKNIIWGVKSDGHIMNISAADLLKKELTNGNDRISLVCLGALTNIWIALKEYPPISGRIERIIWYNDSVKPPRGFNYECDKESADGLLKLNVRMDIISNLNLGHSYFDTALVDVSRQSGTRLAHILRNVFDQPAVNEKLKQNHFRLCDDLVAIYITNPELFGINTDMDNLRVRYTKEYDVEGIREVISDMIKGIYTSEHNVVFNSFPTNREMFNYDVRPIIDSAIARYGYEEWKANVMTDEFHGHLGVFSIVGAKMGIKAREIFGAGPDMLDVVTYAGTKPPYSCLTDGIQVSTGATLGMGTIHLAADSKAQPSALFTYKNRSVRITLKKEYLEQVEKDINEGIMKFGLMDDGYWKLIRHNALKYWLEWDRDKIFDIVFTDEQLR
jgi:pyrimidine-specific ribonucleoside hydrolase